MTRAEYGIGTKLNQLRPRQGSRPSKETCSAGRNGAKHGRDYLCPHDLATQRQAA